MDNAVWIALLAPLLGALFCGFFAGSLGRAGTAVVACTSVGLAFVAALLTAAGAGDAVQASFRWVFLDTGGLHAEIGAFCDPLTATMLLVVTGVGFLIHCYSAGYMSEERDFGRYFAFMNLFIVAMVTLVIATSMPMLLIGWGGVGFASYALIGFYYRRPSAVMAARKAFVINLIGDLGLLLALFGMAAVAPRGDLSLLPENLAAVAATGYSGWIAVMLLVAAYAKSAQLPLHTWLPDAMEGPTPVSALIHAATMVTAGVYLVVRTHPLFEAVPGVMGAMAVMGALSALYAATAALAQSDLKRVLAYSTMSQLGYMFMAAGVGAYSAAMFHLVTHAFFKALLFLAAGMVIHALHDEQSMLRMGGLRERLPVAWWAFLAGTLAIAGIPLLSGFFSKDEILNAAYLAGEHGLTGGLPLPGGHLAWIVGVLTALLTAFYMFRALFLTFLGAPRYGNRTLHAPGPSMVWPVSLLLALSLVGGVVNLPPAFARLGLPPVILTWFLQQGSMVPPVHGEAPFWASLGVPVLAAGLGLLLAWVLVLKAPPPEETRVGPLARFLQAGWGFDAAYGYLALGLQFLAAVVRGPVDRFLSDMVPEGVGASVHESGRAVGLLQSGMVRAYALALLAGLVVFLACALAALKGGA